jgi:DNA-binding transcriptional LysR family regulator
MTERDGLREARLDRMASMAAFTKVVGAGSFSAAAREMQVSQALVTKQIQELEGWLGARLLNRTTRRLSLTEAGTAFYSAPREFLKRLKRLRMQPVRCRRCRAEDCASTRRSHSACSI